LIEQLQGWVDKADEVGGKAHAAKHLNPVDIFHNYITDEKNAPPAK